MALYDDKRFILSHIHHSFITCDDTGSSEAVMLTENALERYPPTALYHTPFDYDSDEEFYYGVDRRYDDDEDDDEGDHEGDEGDEEGDDDVMAEGNDKEGDEKTTAANDKVDGKMMPKVTAAAANLISQDDLDFFKVTELDYKSDLLDDHYANTTGINNTQNNSFDIMSESFEVGMRRRSNTAQRLEKLKKERKYQSKTRVVTWKSPTKVVSVVDQALGKTVEKRLVVHPTALPPEEIAMLEFDEKEGVYYETEEYRKFLFPYNPEGDPTGETDSGEEIEDEDEEFLVVEEEEDQSEQKVDPKEELKQEKSESQDSDDPVGELPQLKSPTRSSEGAKRRSSAFASATNHRRQSKSVAANQSSQNRRKSVLTLAIESSPAAPLNPFNKFTRFNGLVSEGEATKRIRIFFKIFEGSQFGDKLLDKFDKDDKQKTIVKLDFTKRLGRNFASSGIAFGVDWIEVVVLASARVSDLIGLICWNYTHLQLGPPLKEDPTAYALKIAEENGDVDNDFPALTAGDDIKRYGFPYLALVELETHIVVTVHFEPDQVFSQITLSSLTVTLEEIVEQVRKKRPHLFRALDGGSSSHHHQRPLSPTAEEGGGNGTSKPKSPTSPISPSISTLDASRIRLTLSTEPGKPLELSSKIAEYVETPTGSRASSHQAVAFSLKILSREEAFKAAGAKNSRQQLLDVTDALPSTGKDGEEISTGSFKGSLFKSGLHNSSAATLRANRSSIALYSLDTSSSAAGANEPTSSSYTNTSTILGRGKGLRSRDWSQNMLDQMEAPLYQAFELNAVHKLYNTPVEMGISGTKVEITPRSGGGGSYGRSPSSSGGNGGGSGGGHSNWTSNFADRLRARFNQMKAINMDVEDVVDCEVIPRAKMEVLGRHYFKLVYYNGSGEFKSLKFEGDALTVDDILFKLANVMKMRTSPRRVEYQAYKNRKKSLSTKIYLRSRMMLSSSSSSSSDDLTDDGGGGGGNGGGGNSTAGGAGMSTGAESVLSDPSGPEGSWIGTHLGRQKREAKFCRFRSRP